MGGGNRERGGISKGEKRGISSREILNTKMPGAGSVGHPAESARVVSFEMKNPPSGRLGVGLKELEDNPRLDEDRNELQRIDVQTIRREG